MGEVQLPSIWGEHEQAAFEPIVIRGRLVTVLSDEPSEWHDRLQSLGFRRSGESWVRLGAMAQAEYQYLSPEISMVAMRPERAFIAVNEDRIEAPVPYDLADAVLSLWQRQRTAVGAALSFEHGERFSDGAIWSVVETLLDGGRSPAVDSLLRLAATKMASEGLLSPEADAYCRDAEFEGLPTDLESPVGHKLLVARGEVVTWSSQDEVRQGRSADDFAIGDRGLWVYEGAPIFAGGYAAHPPVWVGAEQIVLASERTVQVEVPQATESAEQSYQLTLPGEPDDFHLLEQYCQSLYNRDPVMTWNAGDNPFMQSLKNAGREDSAERFKAWFGNIEGALKRKTDEYFDGIPLEFRLCISKEMSSDEAMSVRYGVTIRAVGEQGYLTAAQNPAFVFLEDDLDTPPGSQVNRSLDFSKCDEIQTLYSSRRRLFVEAAKKYSESLGSKDVIVPSYLLDQHLPEFWKSVAQKAGGQVTEESLVGILAATYKGRPYLDVDFIRRRSGAPVFEGSSRVFDTGSGGRFEIQLTTSTLLGITLADASKHVSGAWADSWNPSQREGIKKYESYLVSVEAVSAEIPAPAALLLPNTKKEGAKTFSVAHFNERDAAVEAYNEILKELTPDVAKHHTSEIENLRKSASSADLADRFRQVPGKLRKMDDKELSARVRAELHLNFNPFPKYSSLGQEKIVSWVVGALREDGNQGVVLAGAKRHYWYKKVPFTSEMLSQSREAELGFALANYMDALRGRKQGVYVDGVAIADAELVAHVNGDNAAALTKEKVTDGVYSDTGVVAGFAAKDIRGLGRSVLLEHASVMSDGQKTKYITKDLIWPKKSLLELKEQVADVRSAFFYDLIWRSLPKKPKSNSWSHVQAFISLVAGLRSDLDEAVKKPFQSSHVGENFVTCATQSLTELYDDPGIRRFYTAEKLKGYSARLDQFAGVLANKNLMRDAGEADWSEIVKIKERAKAKPVSNRVTRDEVIRVGPDYRNGKSVTPEDFIRTFGFSGVEYGNYTSLSEREKNLNFAFDSMMDFVRVLGWEPMVLSLGGRLGLCFGSRGYGGRRAPNAHFEPANRAINLTRMRGDGSLAHEYFHAIANHFGRIATGAPTDLLDSFASPLLVPGSVPAVTPMGRLRAEVLTGFHNLIVAIMRAPENDSNVEDISLYTRRSPMLASAIAADEKKDRYWSLPSEMFARAMEIWFKQRLDLENEQNDYLVASSKGATGGVYPTADHMVRIDHFAEKWLAAIRAEMEIVNHNYLGETPIPVLFSTQRAKAPISRADLFDLADAELTRLFGQMRPGLKVEEREQAYSGFYSLASHLMVLNAANADRGTFYHEAWHAAHNTLLRTDEQLLLAEVFKPGTPIVERLVAVLKEEGMYSAVDDLGEGTLEIQAYAFQMWEAGKFSFGDMEGESSFTRVDSFISGVETCADLLGGPTAALRIFERFKSGDLSDRSAMSVAHHEAPLVDAEWDDGSTVVWNFQPDSGVEHRPRYSGMR